MWSLQSRESYCWWTSNWSKPLSMDCTLSLRWTFPLWGFLTNRRLCINSCALREKVSNYWLNKIRTIRLLLSWFRLKRSKIRVVLGDHDQTTTEDAPAKMRAVAAIIRHRNFDADSYNHDIALLKLRKPVEFTKNIRPICLPSSSGR